MELINIIGSVFGIVFIVWPLAVGGAFSKGGIRSARWAWGVIFIGWLFAKLLDPLPSFLIPEPYNTYVFFGVGLIFLVSSFFKVSRNN